MAKTTLHYFISQNLSNQTVHNADPNDTQCLLQLKKLIKDEGKGKVLSSHTIKA